MTFDIYEGSLDADAILMTNVSDVVQYTFPPLIPMECRMKDLNAMPARTCHPSPSKYKLALTLSSLQNLNLSNVRTPLSHLPSPNISSASLLHLVPLPCRLRTRTPRLTPLTLLRAKLQITIQFRTRILPMDEITEASSHTALPTIQPAASFAEVGDGGQLAVDGARGIPAGVKCVAGFLRAVFIFETGVDVADEIYFLNLVSNLSIMDV